MCYGHQIVGRALGAKVAKSEGGAWEVSVCQVNLTGKGKELFGGRDTIVSKILRGIDWKNNANSWIDRASTKCTKTSYTTIQREWKS